MNLRADPLFGGLTRPATLFGVPIDALTGPAATECVPIETGSDRSSS